MTKTFFTSDTHFGHVNILKFNAEQRPFKDTEEMDEAIIRRWNNVVSPEDTVYHLGDVALGNIAKSLPKVARLNGYKIAVMGNHDRPFMRAGKADELDWRNKYADVFEEVWSHQGGTVRIHEYDFIVSHFPYDGDHTENDKYVEERPKDLGYPLIHGHTHLTNKVSTSKYGGFMYHVGMDAHELTPVNSETIYEAYLDYEKFLTTNA